MPEPVIPRSPASAQQRRFTLGPALLFCPASRPERFPKAAERADAVIADLEDAVVPGEKEQARQNVVQALNWEDPGLDPATTMVRVNAASSGERALQEHRRIWTRWPARSCGRWCCPNVRRPRSWTRWPPDFPGWGSSPRSRRRAGCSGQGSWQSIRR